MAKILLVDDDELLRELLEMYLDLEGHQVVHASNGSEALDVLSREDCDAVVLDLMMPVMDGLRFMRALEDSSRPRPAVLVLSSVDRPEVRAELEAAGISGVIRKPVAPPELAAWIAAVVAAA